MVSMMLYPCILCVALLIDLFVCCVFDSVCELFGETISNMFGWVVILLLNDMEVGVGALLDIPCVCV